MRTLAEIERAKADRCRRMMAGISTVDVVQRLRVLAAEFDAEAVRLGSLHIGDLRDNESRSLMEPFRIRIEEGSDFSEGDETHLSFDDACRSAAQSALGMMRDRATTDLSTSAKCSITALDTGVVRQVNVTVRVNETLLTD